MFLSTINKVLYSNKSTNKSVASIRESLKETERNHACGTHRQVVYELSSPRSCTQDTISRYIFLTVDIYFTSSSIPSIFIFITLNSVLFTFKSHEKSKRTLCGQVLRVTKGLHQQAAVVALKDEYFSFIQYYHRYRMYLLWQ